MVLWESTTSWEGRERHALGLERLHHLELGAYLVPLAVYELHLRAQKAGRASPIRHSGKRCYVDPDHGHRIPSSSASVRIAAFLLIWRAASISLDGAKAMTFTEHPRLLARVAGAFYLIITAFALFAYLYVRGQVIVPSDMAQTATNILAHERLYRLGFSAATIVVICNPPMGLIADDDDGGCREAQTIKPLMRQDVGCGLSHIARHNHLTANIQVGKQGERSDDQVERARNARKQTRMFGESHGFCPV